MFKSVQKGFTLIEVLVVIGILGVLATVALVAINPAEAQKKARDTQRLKDVATLNAILEQYLNDNPGQSLASVSSGATPNKSCTVSGWLTKDVCSYITVLPADPASRQGTFTNNAGVAQTAALLQYSLVAAASGYKLCIPMESTANKARVDNANDGGNSQTRFEIGSDMTLTCP